MHCVDIRLATVNHKNLKLLKNENHYHNGYSHLGSAFYAFPSGRVFFFFFCMDLMHYLHDPQIRNSVTFSLKLDLTILFTHLKIILLQCFQFSVFNFSKISFFMNVFPFMNMLDRLGRQRQTM